MRQMEEFIRWVLGLDLSTVNRTFLERPVDWRLPDVLCAPAQFGNFNVRFMQHDLGDDRHPISASSVEALVLDNAFDAIPYEVATWLFSPHADTDQRKLRALLWIAADLNPPTHDPRLTRYPYTLTDKSLLLQLGDTLTYGYHGGRWGKWELSRGSVLKLPLGKYPKSPLKQLKQATELERWAYDTTWADAVFNYHLYYQPLPYPLLQMLSHMRLVVGGRLVYAHQRIFFFRRDK